MSQEKSVPRRDWLKWTGGAIGGLIVGGAAGYLARPTVEGPGVTTTVTAPGGAGATTVTETQTITAAGGGGAGPVSLDYWTIPGPQYDMLVSTFSDYMKTHPNVKVNTTQTAETGFETTVFTRYTSAPPPDFGFIYGGATYIPPLARAGLILRLDDYFAEYGWDKVLGDWHTNSVYKVDDHFYAVPHDMVYAWYIFYNKGLLSKLGLTVPAKINDLYAAVDTAKKAGYLGVTCGFGTVPNWLPSVISAAAGSIMGPDRYNALWQAYGPDLTTSNFDNRAVKFTDDDVVASFEMCKTWNDKMWADGIVGMTETDAESAFASGKAPFFCLGSWGPSVVQGIVKPGAPGSFEWGTFGIPGDFGKYPEAALIMVANEQIIASKTTKVTECLNAIDFGLSTWQQAKAVENFGELPTIKLDTSTFNSPRMAELIDITNKFTPVYTWAFVLSSKIMPTLTADVGSVMTGKMTAADAAKDMEAVATRAHSGAA